MPGMLQVFRKELSDYMGSKRFIILLLIVYLAGVSSAALGVQSLKAELAEQTKLQFLFLRLYTSYSGVAPPFIFFVGFFAPIIGLAFGFDAINRELASGNLSRILSQPVHRDAIINGKFLAGLVTVGTVLFSIVLVIAGLGLIMIGIPPGIEETLRIVIFMLVSLVYAGLWMSVAVLFSILFRRVATSALATIAVWIFFTFFMFMVAGAVANIVIPLKQPYILNDPNLIIAHEELYNMVMRISPTTLYEEATVTLLNPSVRTFGPVLAERVVGLIPTPLPVGQSLLLIWPHMTGLTALMLICFTISYVKFMRQEIRAL